MTDQPTCGQGLAEHASLPAKLGELLAALAANLEVHQNSLVLTDEHARAEYRAYVRLATEHRGIAAQLASVAEHMAGYRHLPMGAHDERAFADPQVMEAFETFVRREEELLALLQRALERDRAMLDGMRG